MWTYRQTSACIEDFTGKIAGSGYSGKGEGRNNPVLQDVRAGSRLIGDEWVPVDGLTPSDWGPIPQGIYTMLAPVDTETHGPFVLWLTPDPDNDMHGRSGFGVHGDEANTLEIASEGCIVTRRPMRELLWASGDRRIQVIP